MLAQQIVLEAIAELNAADQKSQIPLNDDTCLYGPGGHLDSIKLLWLVSLIEAKFEERTALSLTLADEKAFSQKNSPFQTIERLCSYLHARAAELNPPLCQNA